MSSGDTDHRLVKGVEELVNEFDQQGPASGFLACIIAILYFGTVYGLEKLGSSTVWKPGVRTILADYAYVVRFNFDLTQRHANSQQFGTLFWVGFSHFPGRLEATHIERVPVTKAFFPTQPRDWLIDFWNLDTKWVFVALPFGFLTMLLFYYDHVCLPLRLAFGKSTRSDN